MVLKYCRGNQPILIHDMDRNMTTVDFYNHNKAKRAFGVRQASNGSIKEQLKVVF